MEKIIQSPFKKMKKISLDVNEELLQVIDELVKLTNTNRTVIIGSLIGKGMSPLFRHFETEWKKMMENKNLSEEKRKLIKSTIEKLREIEKTKWDPDHYTE